MATKNGPAGLCPRFHNPYASQLLADNVAAGHMLARPNCPGFEAFPCNGHWHVGHVTPSAGRRCKADEEHAATAGRLRGVRAAIRRRDARSTFQSRSSARRATMDQEAAAPVQQPRTPEEA